MGPLKSPLPYDPFRIGPNPGPNPNTGKNWGKFDRLQTRNTIVSFVPDRDCQQHPTHNHEILDLHREPHHFHILDPEPRHFQTRAPVGYNRVRALLGSGRAPLGFDRVPPNFDRATLSFGQTPPEFNRAPPCFDCAPPPFGRNYHQQTLFDRIPPEYDLAPPSLDREFPQTFVGHDYLAPLPFDREYHQNLQIEQHNFQIEGDYESGWNFDHQHGSTHGPPRVPNLGHLQSDVFGPHWNFG